MPSARPAGSHHLRVTPYCSLSLIQLLSVSTAAQPEAFQWMCLLATAGYWNLRMSDPVGRRGLAPVASHNCGPPGPPKAAGVTDQQAHEAN